MKTRGGTFCIPKHRINLTLAYRDFLTGFRKRKLARHEAGKAKAIERERLSRLEVRREVRYIYHIGCNSLILLCQKRKELAERAAENVKAAEGAYAGDYDSGK
jgi:ribosomal RNA-processing protein 17